MPVGMGGSFHCGFVRGLNMWRLMFSSAIRPPEGIASSLYALAALAIERGTVHCEEGGCGSSGSGGKVDLPLLPWVLVRVRGDSEPATRAECAELRDAADGLICSLIWTKRPDRFASAALEYEIRTLAWGPTSGPSSGTRGDSAAASSFAGCLPEGGLLKLGAGRSAGKIARCSVERFHTGGLHNQGNQ
mmetsp:Transcript_59613/g.132749  ORF Transcript_59613/g.132749 Transcript_59613/m.132749 type:complete len:189 (-) Transcript_59613:11-577(-)